MSWSRAGGVVCCAVVVTFGSVAPAWGQTTVFTTNGFEASAGYTLGDINGQQSFQATPPSTIPFLPTPTFAGQVVDTPTFNGGQAFKVVGSQLVDSPAPNPNDPFNSGFNGGNFWYRSYTSGAGGTGYRPLAAGTPFVYAQAQVRTSGATPLAGVDMPFAGLHFEGFTSNGTQQSLSPVYVNLNGGITVFTNSATSQGTFALTTADGLVPREQWHNLAVEFNFSTQKFRVFVDGQPVQFTRNGNNANLASPVTDVPFRDTNGATVQLAEIGVVAFYGRDTSGTPYLPQNDFFVDDYTVTASAAPVPEPLSVVSVGFVAVAVGGRVRRRTTPPAA